MSDLGNRFQFQRRASALKGLAWKELKRLALEEFKRLLLFQATCSIDSYSWNFRSQETDWHLWHLKPIMHNGVERIDFSNNVMVDFKFEKKNSIPTSRRNSLKCENWNGFKKLCDVLVVQSPVLARALSNDIMENINGVLTVDDYNPVAELGTRTGHGANVVRFGSANPTVLLAFRSVSSFDFQKFVELVELIKSVLLNRPWDILEL